MKRVPAQNRKDAPSSAVHPIAVVARRTGLTQDVLRVWERRYGAVRPERGPGGQRVYSDADIERLSLLNAAAAAGRSIGQIARLSNEELAKMVEDDAVAGEARSSASPTLLDGLVDTALALTRTLESTKLDAHLRRASGTLGVPAFVQHVAVPLLRRVGDEWHAGRLTPAQEHLASSILHDILVGTMRGFAHGNGAPRLLVATPAGERHAIGAALVGAFAAVEGWNVIYLGTDLPAADIAAAAVRAEASVVALSIVYADGSDRVLDEIRSLRAALPEKIGIIIGGAGADLLKREVGTHGIRVANGLEDLLDLSAFR